jgi:hypothetical protein
MAAPVPKPRAISVPVPLKWLRQSWHPSIRPPSTVPESERERLRRRPTVPAPTLPRIPAPTADHCQSAADPPEIFRGRVHADRCTRRWFVCGETMTCGSCGMVLIVRGLIGKGRLYLWP